MTGNSREDVSGLVDSFDQLFTSTISDAFEEKGYAIVDCENIAGLKKIKSFIFEKITEEFAVDAEHEEKLFDQLHLLYKKDINDLRMRSYGVLNSKEWLRPTLLSCCKTRIFELIGNELVMQNKVNLSIMKPGDDGSTLPVHSDAHSGESPYQVNIWVPLTNCYGTKSMFILPKKESLLANTKILTWLEKGGRSLVMENISKDLVWLEVPFGKIVLFSPNLFHGSVANNTEETRWSLNVRIKSLFSPYNSDEKGLGSFYSPVRLSPSTKIGLSYVQPSMRE